MSGKNNMKNYLNTMNDVDRLNEIVRIRQADNCLGGIITDSETEGLEEVTLELFSPTKTNEQGEKVRDLDHFMEMMDAFTDIQIQSQMESGREAAMWKAYFDKQQPESYVTKHGQLFEANTERAKAYASRSTYSSHIDSAVNNMVMMGGKGLNDTIASYWNEALMQNETLKKRFEDRTGFKVEEHMNPDDFAYFRAILGFVHGERVGKMSENDRQLVRCGIQVNKFESAADSLKLQKPDATLSALQTKKSLEMPFAWEGAMGKLEVLTQPNTLNGLKNALKANQEELLRTAKDTIGLYNVMENNYKSLLYNTNSYEHMATAAKNLRDKYKEFGLENADAKKVVLTKEQEKTLTELLDKVAVESGRYVKDHAERRGSETGKGRFETAMAMLGTISYGKAAELTSEVNKIRAKSTKKDKQMVDLDALLTDRHVRPGVEYGVRENEELYAKVKSVNLKEAEKKLVSAMEKTQFEDAKAAIYQDKPEVKLEKMERSKLGLKGLMAESKEEKKKVEAPKSRSRISRQVEKIKDKKKEQIKDKYQLG